MSATHESPELVLTLVGCCLADDPSDVRAAILEVGLKRVEDAMKHAIDIDGQGDTAHRLLSLLGVMQRQDADDEAMEQVHELTEAGWTAEDPRAVNHPHLPPPKTIWEKTAVAAWYWRKPSKREGKPGRRFLSTNQAWRAMKREAGEL